MSRLNLPAVRFSLLRRLNKTRTLDEVCNKRFEIAPAETMEVKPGIAIQGQMERVVSSGNLDLSEEIDRVVRRHAHHSATNAYELHDVQVRDGSLYKSGWSIRLRNGKPALAVSGPVVQVEHAALASSWGGVNFFGHWLLDDIPLHTLAKDYGTPISLRSSFSSHEAQYSRMFGVSTNSLEVARCHRLTVFDDNGHNASKRRRILDMREQVVERYQSASHPGIMILRGGSGSIRRLRNEMQIAETVSKLGLQIIDPLKETVDDILSKAVGSRLLVGVEGSHLCHGLIGLAPGASILTMQPPDRFCNVLKDFGDTLGLNYGFVVGSGSVSGFQIEERDFLETLDLMEH